MNNVAISIRYAGLQVGVVKYEGTDYVLLKQIVDSVGVDWRRQRRKVIDSAWRWRRFGLLEMDLEKQVSILAPAGVDIPTSNPDSGEPKFTSNPDSGAHMDTSNPTYATPIWIRLDRVAAFMATINPDRVRVAGNDSAADFLEQKIAEWDDALHDYEDLGVAFNVNHARTQEALRKQRASFAQMIGVKNRTETAVDRKALSHVLQQMAGEMGVPYQLDIGDDT